MDLRKNSSSIFILIMLGVFLLFFPASPEHVSTKTDDSLELVRLEKRAEQAEECAEYLNSKLSNLENQSTIKLLHDELDVVESGAEPTGSWGNYYLILLEKLNREQVNPQELSKLLDRMVGMTKKGKYFFPGQADNLEAFYRDVEHLRPKM